MMNPSELKVYKALQVLQRQNLKALTEGDGRGYTTAEMAAILAGELDLPMDRPAEIREYSDLLAHLQRIEKLTQSPEPGFGTFAVVIKAEMDALCAWWLFGVWERGEAA